MRHAAKSLEGPGASGLADTAKHERSSPWNLREGSRAGQTSYREISKCADVGDRKYQEGINGSHAARNPGSQGRWLAWDSSLTCTSGDPSFTVFSWDTCHIKPRGRGEDVAGAVKHTVQ